MKTIHFWYLLCALASSDLRLTVCGSFNCLVLKNFKYFWTAPYYTEFWVWGTYYKSLIVCLPVKCQVKSWCFRYDPKECVYNYEKIKIQYSDAVTIAALFFFATDSRIVPSLF